MNQNSNETERRKTRQETEKYCYTHQNTKRKQKESIRQPINGRKLKEQKKENKVRQNCKHSK